MRAFSPFFNIRAGVLFSFSFTLICYVLFVQTFGIKDTSNVDLYMLMFKQACSMACTPRQLRVIYQVGQSPDARNRRSLATDLWLLGNVGRMLRLGDWGGCGNGRWMVTGMSGEERKRKRRNLALVFVSIFWCVRQ